MSQTEDRVQALTHSRLACYRTCPRKEYLRYTLGLAPDVESEPLRIGSAFHAAKEAIDKGGDPNAAIGERLPDPFDVAVAAAMVGMHSWRWANNPLEVVASELEFEIPLINPATGRPTPIFRLRGKIDRIVRLDDGRLALMEYKTTSRDFTPGAQYWLKLHMDQQLSLYVIAARQLGYDIATILYDVTRRPSLRPLRATPEDQRKFTKDGRLYANQRKSDEAVDEYRSRLVADMMERPDHYFARIEIPRLDSDLVECQDEIWQQQQAMRISQRAGHAWRNPEACVGNYGQCEYLPICSFSDIETRTPQGYRRLDNVHPELSGSAAIEG